MSLKYARAKSILLGIKSITPKYQRDRVTKEQNSDKKGIGFELQNGRQLALMNNPNETNIFIEDVGRELPQNLSGVPYPSTKTRSHAINTIAPRVRGLDKTTGSPGKPALYVTLNSEADLYKLLDWYQSIDNHEGVDPKSTSGTEGVRPIWPGSISSESNLTSENESILGTDFNGICQPMSLEALQAQLDRRNEIGEAGELIAIEYEHCRLKIDTGCTDPECYVKHVALTDVGRGYDIESSWPGHERFIEVKSSTNSGNDIFMSDNEKRVLTGLGDKAWLYRVVVDANGDGEVVLRINDPMNKIPDTNISAAVWRIQLPKSDE